MASTEHELSDEPFAVLVGRQLRAFRLEARLSQSKLARRIDVADATVQRIEAGRDTTTTTIQDLGQIARCARVTDEKMREALGDSLTG